MKQLKIITYKKFTIDITRSQLKNNFFEYLLDIRLNDILVYTKIINTNTKKQVLTYAFTKIDKHAHIWIKNKVSNKPIFKLIKMSGAAYPNAYMVEIAPSGKSIDYSVAKITLQYITFLHQEQQSSSARKLKKHIGKWAIHNVYTDRTIVVNNKAAVYTFFKKL